MQQESVYLNNIYVTVEPVGISYQVSYDCSLQDS